MKCPTCDTMIRKIYRRINRIMQPILLDENDPQTTMLYCDKHKGFFTLREVKK